MSIINQALKKAQRERRQTHDRDSWVQSLPPGSAAAPRRRPVLWVVSAMLFALGSGAAMHAWLSGPAAHLPPVLRPARPVADAAPAMQPATSPAAATDSGARALPPAAVQQPPQSRTAAATPVPTIVSTAPRQPALSPADYVSRGNDLYRQGQYRAAVHMYEAALELRPGDLKARNNLGTAYMQLAMDDRAAGAFEAVLRLDGTYGLAYYNLACVHARAGDAAEAAEYLRRAVEIEPRARDWARTDGDFALVREAPQFRRHLEP